MNITIREYRPDDWREVCRVHDLARPDELRGSFDERAFIPLVEDPEAAYIDECDEETAKRIIDIFSESFVTGTAAEKALDLYVTNAIALRES